MTTLFYILAYLAVIGFVATAAIKVKGYLAASPLHARWELYPVPHEGPKGSYGGSFMEETAGYIKRFVISSAPKILIPITTVIAVRTESRSM